MDQLGVQVPLVGRRVRHPQGSIVDIETQSLFGASLHSIAGTALVTGGDVSRLDGGVALVIERKEFFVDPIAERVPCTGGSIDVDLHSTSLHPKCSSTPQSTDPGQ
jgi:hypothetical protein